ncbi:MAG: hypothetical protein ACD_62C00392G0005 [uncultured bacterium]|nr:MAG: hypothetical protein ACD_62C00392G0005 [uncultured bacterium]
MEQNDQERSKAPEWPQQELPVLTPEQVIEWLDGFRQFMWEVWQHNAQLRKDWERLNQQTSAIKDTSHNPVRHE